MTTVLPSSRTMIAAKDQLAESFSIEEHMLVAKHASTNTQNVTGV